MYVLYGHAELFLPHSLSLKGKRKTIQSVNARIRKRFNISIAEVNYQDLWQRSSLGFASACNAYTEAELMVSVIKDTLDLYENDCDVVDFFYVINQI